MTHNRGEDFDAVRTWANVHLRELLRELAPDAFGALRGDRCPCPMHGGDGLNLSLYANPKGPGELWTCHSGCGTSGGGVELVQNLTGRGGKAGAVEVLRELAPRAGVTVGGAVPSWDKRPYRPVPKAPAPPRPLPVDPCAELRADGVIPASPVAMHTALVRHLTLGPLGAAYLTGRGLDPDAARAYSFRSLETRSEWDALEAFLAENYTPEERTAAGLADGLPLTGRAVLVLPYRTADGRGYCGVRFRSLEGKDYRSLKGYTYPVPFNADALHEAEEVHLVEGELNAYTLHTYGLRALGLPGAGTGLPGEWLAALRPVGRVVAWYDADKAGENGWARLADTLAATVGRQWTRERVRRVKIARPDGVKDANDLHRRGELAPFVESAEWRTA
jgi:hypothetical protein